MSAVRSSTVTPPSGRLSLRRPYNSRKQAPPLPFPHFPDLLRPTGPFSGRPDSNDSLLFPYWVVSMVRVRFEASVRTGLVKHEFGQRVRTDVRVGPCAELAGRCLAKVKSPHLSLHALQSFKRSLTIVQ